MTLRRWLLALLAMIALMALFLTVCGGGDDGGGDSGDGGASGQTNAGNGGDEQYVAVLCKSFAKFSSALDNVDLANLDEESDIDSIQDLFQEPTENLVADLKKAKPPKDVEPYHDNLVKSLDDDLEANKDGFEITDFNSEVEEPDFPPAIQERLLKVAEKNADCIESGLLESFQP